MYERFEQLLQERGLKPYRVSKETGISQSTLSSWKSSGGMARDGTLKLLSDYFGVSIAWLKGETDERRESQPAPTAGDGLDAAKRALIDKIRGMDPETVAALNTLADSILAKRGR